MGWYFIPWTVQYLIGFVLALLISTYIFSRQTKSRAYQFFLTLGFSVSMWALLAFLHRNASTAALSKDLLGSAMFFAALIPGFLLSTILYIEGKKWYYSFVVAPAFIVGISQFALAPFDVVWTSYGWSYMMHNPWMMIYSIFNGVYLLAILIILAIGMKRSSARALRKKYVLIFLGYGVLYGIGMGITNVFINMDPAFPPMGGILLSAAFLFIAYAITLPAEKIIPSKIRFGYPIFLNKLLEETPGKELGQDITEFNRFLGITGLNKVVSFKKDKITLNSDQLNSLNLLGITEKIMEYLEEHDWATEARAHYKDLFIDSYITTRKKSRKTADKWFERMLRKHGAFLYKHGILDAMPEGVRIPGIFRELEVGKSYLVREDRPTRCLEMLRAAVNYGFKGLCFTMRYPPQKVRNEYGLEGVSIIWLKFRPKEDVKTLAPDKLDELEKTISKFIALGGAVVLVDAFDQIKVVNGFERSMKFLQKMKVAAAESGANLLISMRPESVWEKESAAIAKITKLHQSGPTWTSFELL